MAVSNEELMRDFIRTGKIMQHWDGKKCCHHHGHKHGKCEEHEGPHGPHGEEGEGAGHGCHGRHGHGHGHGPHGRGCGRHGQARALSLIAMQEGITQKDLAYLLGIRPQSAGEMLAKLEEYGLIERRKSETDARAIQVYLTEAGRTHAEEIDRLRSVVAEDVFSVLTDEEKEQLSCILGKIQAELDAYRPQSHSAQEEPEA